MEEKKQYGVYAFIHEGDIKYVGSSSCSLRVLETNHRTWRSKYGLQGKTHFRENLERIPEGQFVWLVAPDQRTRKEAETIEKELINKHRPLYNKDYDPVGSSIRNGRYT